MLAPRAGRGAAALAALTLASATDPVHNMSLVMLPAGAPRDAGSCLDGSPYGMYQILNASSPNWIIYFDGGGACESPAGCVKRAAGSSGSDLLSHEKGHLNRGETFIALEFVVYAGRARVRFNPPAEGRPGGWASVRSGGSDRQRR